MNTTECNLEIHIYPLYLCSDYLSSASIRGIGVTLQHGRWESWVPGSHIKCGPVPSSSGVEPRSQISPCQRLSSSCCLAQAFLHRKPTDFQQLNANVYMPTGPLAVAQLPLPLLLDAQEGLQTQGLTCGDKGWLFTSSAALQVL